MFIQDKEALWEGEDSNKTLIETLQMEAKLKWKLNHPITNNWELIIIRSELEAPNNNKNLLEFQPRQLLPIFIRWKKI